MLQVLASVVDRDTPAIGSGHPERGAALLEPLAQALREAGLNVAEHRPATAADVVALGSAWAKRLGIPERRPAWWLTATRPDRAPQGLCWNPEVCGLA